MPKSDEYSGTGSGDYEQTILAQLYSRKMSKSNFSKVKNTFKKETGKDLCIIIKMAHDDMAKKIASMPKMQLADKLRTDTFKLLDYSIWLNFCERKK